MCKGFFSLNNLKDFWRFAGWAYQDIKEIPRIVHHSVNYKVLDNGMDYCYLAEFQDVLYISFRGTGTERNISKRKYSKLVRKWISNFNVYPMVQDGKWGTGMFHNGMYDIFLSFKKDIVNYIQTNLVTKPIVIVGHSRGGPPAFYLHRHLLKNMRRKTSVCFTFGCPNHMTREGVVESRALNLKVYNIINGYDIGTRIPKSLERCGFDVYIKPNRMNILNFWFLLAIKGIKNHKPEQYDDTILSLLSGELSRKFKSYDNYNRTWLNITAE